MKKNLISVVVLALVLVNLILTAVLTITILPETKKANELITQVCSAIDLELKSGSASSSITDVPIDQVATYDVNGGEGMTVNLKDSADGSKHYATVAVSVSMDTENEGYKNYGETLTERESLIKSEINRVISEYTYDEFNADHQGVQDAILEALQQLFGSDFIFSVGFSTVTSQ